VYYCVLLMRWSHGGCAVWEGGRAVNDARTVAMLRRRQRVGMERVRTRRMCGCTVHARSVSTVHPRSVVELTRCGRHDDLVRHELQIHRIFSRAQSMRPFAQAHATKDAHAEQTNDDDDDDGLQRDQVRW
jgi:hypothetical protein